ncbi:MAG TPA: YwqG family protein [Longimicrobium sp.]|nr:YwqG family protein [Longimicrobium sp.]
MEMREALAGRLAEAGVGPHAAPLAAMAKPCIHLLSAAPEDGEPPAGASRIGGAPDLPAGAAWPVWNGAPLSFIAQVDLATTVGMPGAEVLPDAGLLSFFYEVEAYRWGDDPADLGSWRVLYTPPDVPLRRLPFPEALSAEWRYSPCALKADAAMSLPSWQTPEVQALGLDEEEMEILSDLPPRDGYVAYGSELHQLLGWPEPMQNAEMELACQLASSGISMRQEGGYDAGDAEIRTSVAEWCLLMQLASDDNAGMMWGDLGKLYFWIRESDLAARRWDRVWMILQSA